MYILICLKLIKISVPSCEALQDLANGDISYNESNVESVRYPVSTMATFTCDYGYILNGSDSSICQDSLNWDQQTPTCDQSMVLILYCNWHRR